MRIVDEETRKIVMQNRIDALEADNLFESNFVVEDPEEDLEEGDGDTNRKGYSGEYIVEEAEESEEIYEDGDRGA